MTAEVIVANGTGVAMAADSAVTIGNQKTYNSALKLFSLSKVEPVGVMIFGNAVLLDIPWEIIIKSYRKELRDKSFEKLELYCDDFLKYIAATDHFQSEESQTQWVASNVEGYFLRIRNDFLESTKPIIEKVGNLSGEQRDNLLKNVINQHHNDIKKRGCLDGMDADFEKEIRTKYVRLFSEKKTFIFQNLTVNKQLTTKLYDIATWLHTRDIFANNTSGIVIAGYGTEEIFPSIRSLRIEGVLSGKIKCKIIQEKCFSPKNGHDCVIIPYAQEEMVKTFMHGLHPSIGDMVATYLQQLFARLPDLLTDEDLQGCDEGQDVLRGKLKSRAEKLLQDFFDNLKQHISIEQVHPVISMVSALPKDELAVMAESMVNLTAFKRKMSNTLETVGGPVDVAVISKGDGLVWVKRKHYFPRELNNHFFENYFKGVHDGNKKQ